MRVKEFLIIAMVLILIMIMTVPAFAVTNYNVTLKADKTQVNKGDTIKVTVSLSNINVEEGIGAFVGKLTYDDTVFEKVEQANVLGATGWGTVLYNPAAGYLAVERAAGDCTKENNPVMEITLKVKSNAAIKGAQIMLSEITCSTGEEDLVANDVSMQIEVKEKSVNNNNTNNNNTNNNNTNKNNTNSNTVKNNTANKVPNSNLPHAGEENYIISTIIVLAVLGLISYIRYQKMKNF